jgi:hypothetical protein
VLAATTYAPTEEESLMIDLAAWSTAFCADSRIGRRCRWIDMNEDAKLSWGGILNSRYRRSRENAQVITN